MRVIISLDTEDFISPQALDAQLWWLKTLKSYNIRASFECVGELVRKWGKEQHSDIIQLIKQHEIGYHTRFHSLHPVHPEAVEKLSLAEGLAWMYKHEQPGLDTLREVLGTNPVNYCPSGDSWTPATVLFMAANGIKNFACGPFYQHYCTPLWYGGLLAVHYNIGFEAYYERQEPFSEWQADFKRECQRVGKDGVVVLFTHPTMLHSANFWDQPLKHGKIVSLEDIPPAPLRSDSAISRNYNFVEQTLEWLVTNPDIELMVHEDVRKQILPEKRYPLSRLLTMAGLQSGEESRLVEVDETLFTDAYIPESVTDNFNYGWSIHNPAIDMTQIRQQITRLRWTSRKAEIE